MSKFTVGGDVVSYCGKCKLALGHTIATLNASGLPDKCVCNTCKASHKFRDPTAVKKKATRKKTTRRKSVPVAEMWMQQMSTTTTKSQPYSIRTKFSEQDIIDHPKFGPGIVQTINDGDKIEVLFRDEIKTLVHNK